MKIFRCIISNDEIWPNTESRLYCYISMPPAINLNSYVDEYDEFIFKRADSMGLKDLVNDFKNNNFINKGLGTVYNIQNYIKTKVENEEFSTDELKKIKKYLIFLDDNNFYAYLLKKYHNTFALEQIPEYDVTTDFNLLDTVESMLCQNEHTKN